MLLDKNGKLFGLFNLVDVAVMLFLAFAIGAGVYSFRENHASQTTLTVTVKAEHLSNDLAYTLSTFDGDFSDTNGNVVGSVRSVQVKQETQWEVPTYPPMTEPPAEPATTPAASETLEETSPAWDLSPIEVPIPDAFDVSITLTCTGTETHDLFRLASGDPVAVGDVLTLTGGGNRIQVTVTGVTSNSDATD